MVGDCIVEPTRNLVATCHGEETLEPRIMDVLCFLADHPARAVRRDQIIDAVWTRSFGADESLTRAVSRLRKVFGDVRSPAQVIETIPKRGYRLIAPVSQPVDPIPQPAATSDLVIPRHLRLWIAAAVFLALVVVAIPIYRALQPVGRSQSAVRPITVVIPPFEPVDPDLTRSAKVVGDQVAALLSQSSLLGVRRDGQHPDSVPGAFSVHGTLQRVAQGRVRVSVTVAELPAGTNVWSGTFDRALPATPAASDDLSSAIAAELDNRILSAMKAHIRQKDAQDLLPWELTLLATWVAGSDEVFLKAHGPDTFWPQQRALHLDPEYAPAHASLASAMAYQALFGSSTQADALRRKAHDHAERANALAPYNAGVLYDLATYYRLIGDRANAIAALDRVLAVQPGHPVARYDRAFFDAHCNAAAGAAAHRLEQSLASVSSDNPVRWVILSHIADLDLAAGQPVRAVQWAKRSRQIVPMTWSGITLAAAAAATGDTATARRSAAETRREWPALDWKRFASADLSTWCLQGEEQRHAAAAFAALASAAAATHDEKTRRR